MPVMRSILLAVLLFFLPTACAHTASMAERVEKGLRLVGRYDDETFDYLVGLGPEAVPELCKRIPSYDFPYEIMRVIGEWQDPRGTEAVMAYVEKHPEEQAIKVLREIGDPRAETLLLSIASNPANHIAVRFEATAALARLGSAAVREQACDEIMRLHHSSQVAENAWPDPNVILTDAFYLGLCEVQRDAAQEAVAAFVRSGIDGYRIGPVVRLLGRRESTLGRKTLIDALVCAAQYEGDQQDRFVVRLEAVTALYRLKTAVPPEKLLELVKSLEKSEGYRSWKASDDLYHKRKTERLRQLKKEAQEQVDESSNGRQS